MNANSQIFKGTDVQKGKGFPQGQIFRTKLLSDPDSRIGMRETRIGNPKWRKFSSVAFVFPDQQIAVNFVRIIWPSKYSITPPTHGIKLLADQKQSKL